MSRFRYGEYDDGPDPLAPPYDVRAALDELGRSVMEGARPLRALRDLLRRGTQGRSGLDDLLRQVRERRERLRSSGRLDGTLEQARALLDRAVGQERAELFPDPSDDARLRESELDSLPADTAAAVRRLADYEWRSEAARRSFAELRDLLRREILDSQFRGMKEALTNGSPEDMRRVGEMVEALNAMLEADDRGEHTQADFDRFMAEYGDFFPDNPRNLGELVDSLAQRAAAAQRMMNSLTPEQRAELSDLMGQTMAEAGLTEAMERLSGALRSRRPDLAWSGTEEMDGAEGMGMGDATTALEELGELAELDTALSQDYAGAGLDDIDEEAVRRALGRSAVDDLARLRELERELRDQGFLRGSRDRMELTPKAVRRLGETALREVFATSPVARPGQHSTADSGQAGELTGASRPWRFGDEQPLDVVRTLANAATRGRAPGDPPGRLRLRADDFEVAETERRDASAVCLLVDLSYSMVRRDLWGTAKQTAMALHSLVTTRFPQDAVQVIGFNAYARELAPESLAELEWEPVQGTNLQHALLLAGRHLDRHSDFEPIVLIVTDGEPTAHLERDGEATFTWPPSQDTTALTLAEVDRMTRRGAALNVFLLADDPRLEEFVDEVARRNGGRVVRPDTARLGSYVVHDFLDRRRRAG
ncbi:vWA domain-containing protein [Salinactinospora qingdaonensis]|uniref:VWA domain-containing protein n=1 Tax=Salinactinospora qingdaonensis TaxID=702744 RepID=A0ABP7FR80_9ACTN